MTSNAALDAHALVAALASRDFGASANRKRVQSVMRNQRMLQRSRKTDRCRQPGLNR